jgi:hypothetical protein
MYRKHYAQLRTTSVSLHYMYIKINFFERKIFQNDKYDVKQQLGKGRYVLWHY